MFCKNCGKELDSTVAFCPNCGTPTEVKTGYDFYNQYIDDDVKKLIDKNEAYYLTKFTEMKQNGKKTSWNWPAFLVSPLWLIYRKMYLYGVICYIVSDLFNQISGALGLALGIVVGIFGN